MWNRYKENHLLKKDWISFYFLFSMFGVEERLPFCHRLRFLHRPILLPFVPAQVESDSPRTHTHNIPSISLSPWLNSSINSLRTIAWVLCLCMLHSWESWRTATHRLTYSTFSSSRPEVTQVGCRFLHFALRQWQLPTCILRFWRVRRQELYGVKLGLSAPSSLQSSTLQLWFQGDIYIYIFFLTN